MAAIWRVFRAYFFQFLRLNLIAEFMNSLPTATNTEIAYWPYILTAQLEHEKHLYRPTADTKLWQQVFHNLIISESMKGFHGNCSID